MDVVVLLDPLKTVQIYLVIQKQRVKAPITAACCSSFLHTCTEKGRESSNKQGNNKGRREKGS